jgi:hypothetical protein
MFTSASNKNVVAIKGMLDGKLDTTMLQSNRNRTVFCASASIFCEKTVVVGTFCLAYVAVWVAA